MRMSTIIICLSSTFSFFSSYPDQNGGDPLTRSNKIHREMSFQPTTDVLNKRTFTRCRIVTVKHLIFRNNLFTGSNSCFDKFWRWFEKFKRGILPRRLQIQPSSTTRLARIKGTHLSDAMIKVHCFRCPADCQEVSKNKIKKEISPSPQTPKRGRVF